jgi:hypothetical protein
MKNVMDISKVVGVETVKISIIGEITRNKPPIFRVF